MAVIREQFEVTAVGALAGEPLGRGANVLREEEPVARDPDEAELRVRHRERQVAYVEEIHRAGQGQVGRRLHAGRKDRALIIEVAFDVVPVAGVFRRIAALAIGLSRVALGKQRLRFVRQHRDLACQRDALCGAARDANRFARHRVERDTHGREVVVGSDCDDPIDLGRRFERPGDRAHAAERPSHNRGEARKAKPRERLAFGPHHVRNAHHREGIGVRSIVGADRARSNSRVRSRRRSRARSCRAACPDRRARPTSRERATNRSGRDRRARGSRRPGAGCRTRSPAERRLGV